MVKQIALFLKSKLDIKIVPAYIEGMKQLLFLTFFSVLFGCTDFALQSKDGAWVNGRSLEFAVDLQNVLQLFPRGQKMSSQNPDKAIGLEWTSKYGYLGITC